MITTNYTKITHQITIKIYCQYAVPITILYVNFKNGHDKKSFNRNSKREVFWSNLSQILCIYAVITNVSLKWKPCQVKYFVYCFLPDFSSY